MIHGLKKVLSKIPLLKKLYRGSKNYSATRKQRKINKRRKNVAVIGWLGAFNLGDEMMLNVTLSELSVHHHVVTLLTHNADKKVIERYKEYKIVPRNPLTKSAIDAVVKENDVLFVNGGAMLDDRGYKRSSSLARDIARLSKAFIAENKKVIVYGISTNVGLKNKELISDYSSIVEGAAHFSVRDEFSLRELSKFCDDTKIKLVDDIVFADRNPLITNKHKSTRPRIAVTMIFDGETMEHVKGFFDKLIRLTDEQLRIVMFYDENNNDAIRSEELKQHLGENRFRIDEIVNPTDSKELFHAYEDVETIITMRYHGALFGNMMGKKVLFVEYDKHPHYYYKNRYLREHYGYNNPTIKLSEVTKINDAEFREMIMSSSVNDLAIRSEVVQKRAINDLSKIIRDL